MAFRFAALALLALTAPAPAETRIDIELSNFKFTPEPIRMKAGQPYLLHLTSDGGHSFAAPAFFAAAKVAPSDAAKIVKGRIDLEAGDSVDIHLTAPAAGRYETHCTHFLHAAQGMKGMILVS